MKISVIICTYNPIEENLNKCLEAIQKAQEITNVEEVIIIDNNSDVAISERAFISSYKISNKNVRVVNEYRQGLTYARLRGISESIGDLLIFIDDDNVIDEHYFRVAKHIYQSHPFIGAFSGQVKLQFDERPPVWSEKYWGLLVSREFKGDFWSNVYSCNESMPCGAGLCIRREVGLFYFELHQAGKRKIMLDRSKGSLMSAGDNDLSLCSIDIGLGIGLFEDLKLSHLIQKDRLTKEYVKKLAYGVYFSGEVLFYMRGKQVTKSSVRSRIKDLIMPFMMSFFDGQVYRNCQKARKDAKIVALKLLASKNG